MVAQHAVMPFRPSIIPDLEDAGCLDAVRLTYLLWTGYLHREEFMPLLDWLKRRQIPLVVCHTSSHAAPADLKRLVAALQPPVVIPVHPEVPERYTDLWLNARPHPDGAWFDVREVEPPEPRRIASHGLLATSKRAVIRPPGAAPLR